MTDTTEHACCTPREAGYAELQIHDVFPGIQLVFHQAKQEVLDWSSLGQPPFLLLHYCQEGLMALGADGDEIHLEAGDCLLSLEEGVQPRCRCPRESSRGISLCVSEAVARRNFKNILEGVQLQPLDVVRRLCGGNKSCVIRREHRITEIFSSLDFVQSEQRAGFFRVKVLELFILLDGMASERVQSLPKLYVELANQAAEYLSQHMDSRRTIPDLARQFNVSESQLKAVFKAVHGVPVYTYAKQQRMKSAAQSLLLTDLSVTEVAALHGYSNASKFSIAFRTVMGEAPREYRRRHRIKQG